MPPFALALHPEAFATDRPRAAIRFIGQSLPHSDAVRAALAVCADHPLGADLLDWLELLGRLRNLIVHANGQSQQMQPQDHERVAQWLASGKGVTLREERIELASSYGQRGLSGRLDGDLRLAEHARSAIM